MNESRSRLLPAITVGVAALVAAGALGYGAMQEDAAVSPTPAATAVPTLARTPGPEGTPPVGPGTPGLPVMPMIPGGPMPGTPREAPPLPEGSPRLGVEVLTLPGNGLQVLAVHPGSAAEAAGIQLRDVIVELDGAPAPTLIELREAVIAAAEGDGVLSIVVERLGQRVPIEARVTPGDSPGAVPETPVPSGTPSPGPGSF